MMKYYIASGLFIVIFLKKKLFKGICSQSFEKNWDPSKQQVLGMFTGIV